MKSTHTHTRTHTRTHSHTCACTHTYTHTYTHTHTHTHTHTAGISYQHYLNVLNKPIFWILSRKHLRSEKYLVTKNISLKSANHTSFNAIADNNAS